MELCGTAGETATFECSVSGEESTSVTWLKDNKPLSDRLMDRVSKSNVDNSFKLEIQNLLESDTGMYTAHATNAEGASTCTAHLLVQKREYIGTNFLANYRCVFSFAS